MGDRGNVYVKDGEVGVYLYTHWSGDSLPRKVADALSRGESRWDDGQYLARIILDSIKGGDVTGTTGYGITARIGDNGHPVIVVDPETQTVGFAAEGEERGGPTHTVKPFGEWDGSEEFPDI